VEKPLWTHYRIAAFRSARFENLVFSIQIIRLLLTCQIQVYVWLGLRRVKTWWRMRRSVCSQIGDVSSTDLLPSYQNLICVITTVSALRINARGVHVQFCILIKVTQTNCGKEKKSRLFYRQKEVFQLSFKYESVFIPVVPTWSTGHPWYASFHFSFLFLDNR
jgi:hypothetical protein